MGATIHTVESVSPDTNRLNVSRLNLNSPPLPGANCKSAAKKQSPKEGSPPSPPLGLSGDLKKLLGKLGAISLETEDLLLIAVLYLMYRESGDKELLIMIGALLFL